MPSCQRPSLGKTAIGTACRQRCVACDSVRLEDDTVGYELVPVFVVATSASPRFQQATGDIGEKISPVSMSSSLLRQHRPQPSHRDSHSFAVISSRRFVSQNRFIVLMVAAKRRFSCVIYLQECKLVSYLWCSVCMMERAFCLRDL